jgi:hypothetical protein
MITFRTMAVGAACTLLFAVGGPVSAAAPPALRVDAGRLDSGGTSIEAGATLRPGAVYDVSGAREARIAGPLGISLRALPGARFLVTTVEEKRVEIALRSGVLADASAGEGMLDIATPAGVLRGDHAVLFARVANRNVYVEHQQGSKGTAGMFSPGAHVAPLAAGMFRMMALDAGDAPATPISTWTPAPTAAPVLATSARAADGLPAAGSPSATPASAPPVGAEAPIVPYDPSCGPNPCADPPRYCPPPPCAPPPCAPPPTCGGCGEFIQHSGIPVPVRADDTGRPPLTSALSDDVCNPLNGVCACHCAKIPYVHYVEGLECDVSTYKVGNCLVTVRPATRVRVHRLPDGSLQMWAPNIGRDLALIEIDNNQFCYIGDDGFLVIGCECQVQYFRGLVHLYPHSTLIYRNPPPPREQEKSSETTPTLSPTGSSR